MPKNNRFAPLAIPIMIGVALQILFIFPDMRDTPTKALTEFTEAYFKVDRSMTDRLCDQSKTVNDVDVVDRYIEAKFKDAEDRGFGMFYMKDRVSNLRTHIISRDDSSAKLRLTAKVKPPLKAFFTGEGYRSIDEVVTVINEDGKWKVCGNIFSIADL